MVTANGTKLLDVLKTQDGKDLIEAAVTGNLLYSLDHYDRLQRLLRPDKFLILNTGTHIMVINLANLKKLLKNGEPISYEQLMSATKPSDVYDSPLNINIANYTSANEVLRVNDIFGTGEDNYSRFINKNVVSSTLPIEVDGKMGYNTINKRLGIKLDMGIDEMIKNAEMQKEVKAAATVDVVDESPDKAVSTPAPTEEEETINEYKINVDWDSFFKDICE